MVILHHLERSRSHRILWLLEELGVDYDIKLYDRNPKTMQAPPALKQVHPLGKSPVITDGDRVVAESAVIIEYLLDAYGEQEHTLRPEREETAFHAYRYWMHYAEGSAMPPLFVSLVFMMLPKQAPWFLKPILKRVSGEFIKDFGRPMVENHLNYWNETLADTPYFAGESFTAADIQMSFPVEAAIHRFAKNQSYPHIHAWIDRIQKRHAYQQALSIGNDYGFE